MTANSQRETILEFRLSGQFGFINAIDVATGIEVAVTVPAQTSKADREALALRRLAKRLTDLGYVPGAQSTFPSGAKRDGAKNGDIPQEVPPLNRKGLIA
jgi:hypothetical protein